MEDVWVKGQTLLANIREVPPDILSSEEIIRLLLVRTVEAAGMTPVKHTLQVAHFPAPVGGDLRGGYGLSGGMILVESHVYVHTWPEEGYARFELSSCKPFPSKQVLDVLGTILGPKVQIEPLVVPW